MVVSSCRQPGKQGLVFGQALSTRIHATALQQLADSARLL